MIDELAVFGRALAPTGASARERVSGPLRTRGAVRPLPLELKNQTVPPFRDLQGVPLFGVQRPDAVPTPSLVATLRS